MKIDADLILDAIAHRKKVINYVYILSPRRRNGKLIELKRIEDTIKSLVADEEIKAENQTNYSIDINLFDKEEIIENCTVQVLTNTVTGDVSVGWWKN